MGLVPALAMMTTTFRENEDVATYLLGCHWHVVHGVTVVGLSVALVDYVLSSMRDGDPF
jgi:hypothetical protein